VIDLSFTVHPGQQAILNSEALYKVVTAGRRFGKTYIAAILCILEGLKDQNERGHPLKSDAEVMYMAPTFEQAKGIFWPVLKLLAEPVTATTHENTGVLTLINGVRIRLKGMDAPDRARGFKLRYAVLDEYADMHPGAWDAIIQPALMDVEGGALFIGTPKGKNHFYELFIHALGAQADEEGFLEWEAFKFSSRDNPFIREGALRRMYANERYSSDLIKQELEADFLAGSGGLLPPDWWKFDDKEPRDGNYVVTVDLQGFSMDRIAKKKVLKDNSVITVAKICRKGWWIKQQVVGKWDVRETAFRIVQAARSVDTTVIGIERGMAMNAVLPYMDDYMKQYRSFFKIEPLTHGNQHKEDRIRWALQGRLEKGRIILNCDPDLRPWERPDWVTGLIDEAADFPNNATPDDRPDSLAYVDQVAKPIHFDMASLTGNQNSQYDTWAPLDDISGY
jgi:hypothetical protein